MRGLRGSLTLVASVADVYDVIGGGACALGRTD